ncbi:MAG: iron ABC transporter permease [Tissierellia bacterium]|nr:iron ABC transporter permease [Tissierellia bacterium]
MQSRKKFNIFQFSMVQLILLIILIILTLFALRLGTVKYTYKEIITILGTEQDPMLRTIIINLRLPRILVAIMVGACLSVSGALLQSVMQNPLADPGIIGVSSGAGAAATAILLVYPRLLPQLPLFAFLGAALACFLIYILAWNKGIDPVRLILSGVAVNTIFGGVTSLLRYLNTQDLANVMSFLTGSLSSKAWFECRMLFKYATIPLIISLFAYKWANALQLGDDFAKNLGVDIHKARLFLSVIAAFLAATTVASVGMVGFVGLIVPHIARRIVGSDYRAMLITSMLLGSVIVLFADTVGRSAFGTLEMPLGIVMSIVGGPFFLYLLNKGRIK